MGDPTGQVRFEISQPFAVLAVGSEADAIVRVIESEALGYALQAAIETPGAEIQRKATSCGREGASRQWNAWLTALPRGSPGELLDPCRAGSRNDSENRPRITCWKFHCSKSIGNAA